MKTRLAVGTERAFTLVDLTIVVVTLVLAAIWFLSMFSRPRTRG
jgi:flagellar biogenesis protein FliO